MQGEAERALRCRPLSFPNRPHLDADSIDSAIPRPYAATPPWCGGLPPLRSVSRSLYGTLLALMDIEPAGEALELISGWLVAGYGPPRFPVAAP
jgi:hypothetical protein